MIKTLKKKREPKLLAGRLSGVQSWTGYRFSFAYISIYCLPEKFKWGVL